MHRILIAATCLCLASVSSSAQKFGHFSSEYIVKQMPTYQQVEEEILQMSDQWAQDVKKQYVELGKMELKLEAERVLLTQEMIVEREQEIDTKLQEAIDLQQQIFGPGGLYFLRKKALIQPELEKIFEAVERVCKKQGLDYLMDKSGDLTLIYSNPVHDYTDFVLEELGLGDPDDVAR